MATTKKKTEPKKEKSKKDKPKKTNAGKARPVRWQDWTTPDALLLLEGWARNGLTMAQIAHNVGIEPTTLTRWRTNRPEISQALKKGAEVVDFEVENALLKRALGVKTTTRTTRVELGLEGEPVGRQVTTIETEHPPDATAIVFWLKNRRPDKWRKMAPVFERKTEAEAVKLEKEIEKLSLEIEQLKNAEIGQEEAIYIIDSWADGFDEVAEAKSKELEAELEEKTADSKQKALNAKKAGGSREPERGGDT